MAQRRPVKRKRWKFMLAGILIVLILYLAAIIVPYLAYKEVPAAEKAAFEPASFYSDQIGSERVAAIFENRPAMEMHLRLMEQAQHKIVMSNYKLLTDEIGQDYLAVMLKKAEQGVAVELLLDGKNEILNLRHNAYFQAFANQKNVSIYVYNPVSLLHPEKLQAVHHSKYLMIDEKYYLMGGRNINELFLGDYGKQHNRDCELLVWQTRETKSESFQQLEDIHQELLALPETKPFGVKPVNSAIKTATDKLKARYATVQNYYPQVYAQDYDFMAQTVPTRKISILTSELAPENKAPILWYQLNELAKAGDDVRIFTPYIMCGDPMYRDLREVAATSDKAAIVTNQVANGANLFGGADYLNQRKKIWHLGFELNEFSGGDSMHMKAYLIDQRMTLIGSSNMDQRSVYIDTELMAAVDSPELNAIVQKHYEDYLAASRTILPNGEYEEHAHYQPKEMSLARKTGLTLLRILTPLFRRFI